MLYSTDWVIYIEEASMWLTVLETWKPKAEALVPSKSLPMASSGGRRQEGKGAQEGKRPNALVQQSCSRYNKHTLR